MKRSSSFEQTPAISFESPSYDESFDVPQRTLEQDEEREQLLGDLLSKLEADETQEAEVFHKIEVAINRYGWDTFCNEVLTNPNIKARLANPEVSVSLLVECLDMLSIPETFSTEKLRELLGVTQNSVDWVKLQTFLTIREVTEQGELSERGTMIRLLENHHVPDLRRNSTMGEIRAAFRDAIQEYPPDAYFTEFYHVKDVRRKDYLLDKYLDYYDFLPLLEPHCPPEWSITAFVRACYGVPMAHDLLAIYSPSGRFVTTITVDQSLLDNPPMENVEAIYAVHDNLEFKDNEDAADHAYRLMIRSFDILPKEWQERLEAHYESRGLDIRDIAQQCQRYFSVDIVATAHRDVRLATPVGLGEAIEKYIEQRLSECSEKLSTIKEVNLESFAAVFNQEYTLPKKEHGDILATLQSLSLDTLSYLENTLGVNFTSISLREIFSLISHLKSTKNETGFTNLEEFLHLQENTNKITRIKSFLSLEQDGPEMGAKILSIGEQLPLEVANRVFAKYAELVDAAERAYQYLLDNRTTRTQNDQVIAQKISDRLLSRGKDLLIEFASHVTDPSTPPNPAELIERLDQVQVSVEQFKSLFRASNQSTGEHAFSFEDFVGVDRTMARGREISETDRDRMREVYLANYPVSDYPETFRQAILEGFDRALEREDTDWHLLKKDGAVISFLRLDHTEGKPTHFASFNVAPEFQQSKIGEALYKTAMTEERTTHPEAVIEAECDPRRFITQFYLAQGFVGTGVMDYAGTTLLRIVLDPHITSETKDMTPEVIGKLPINRAQVQRITPTHPDFSLLEEGYILTQYQFTNRDAETAYAVFESVGDSPHSTDKA